MELARFNAYNDFPTGMQLFHDAINRLLSDESQVRPWSPAVDIFETETELLFKVDAAGLSQKDIDVQIENGTMTLKGERKFEKDDKVKGYHRIERSYGAFARSISDNGSQFIAKDFKEFIRISGMTHVRTSPYYPQSNGKIERWHKSLKGECIRPGTPLTPEDARRLIQQYVDHYNMVRLHSAIDFVTPADMLAGRQKEILDARDRKLEEARRQRQLRRQQAA